jgi:hypothetical protein
MYGSGGEDDFSGDEDDDGISDDSGDSSESGDDSEEALTSDEESRQAQRLPLRRHHSDEELGEELQGALRALHSRPWLRVDRAYELDDAGLRPLVWTDLVRGARLAQQ